MKPESLLPTVLIPLVFTTVTQFIKNNNPEFFLKYSNWISSILAVLGSVINFVAFMAMNSPLVAKNGWEAALVYFAVVIEGLALGLASAGVYNVGKQIPVVNKFIKSTEQLLEAKG